MVGTFPSTWVIVVPGRVTVTAEYHLAYKALSVGTERFIECVVRWCVGGVKTYRQGASPAFMPYVLYLTFLQSYIIRLDIPNHDPPFSGEHMQTVDMILVIVYVGFMLSLQFTNARKLYKSTTGKVIARLAFVVSFTMVTQYLQLKNNKDFRRGYMVALYVVPSLFWLGGLHYCLIANLLFITQGITYAHLGKVFHYKHSSIAA